MNDIWRDPDLDIIVPRGYSWLLDRGVIGYENSGLEPWYYLDKNNIIHVTDVWPAGSYKGRLVAFARRYDNDDLACFAIEAQHVKSIVVVHGWTDTGYDLVASYDTFWEWLKSVIDDIAGLVDSIEDE